MTSTATRTLDLVFRINDTAFNNAYSNIIQKINNMKVALKGLNTAAGSIFGSSGSTSVATNVTKVTKALGGATTSAHKARSAFLQTSNSLRFFGNESGILKGIALVRSELLLAAFAVGGLINQFKSIVSEARDTQMALAGVSSIAKGMGHDIDETTKMVKKYADTGLMTMKESADAVKMLLSMEGVSAKLADEAMQSMMDWAAFNRLGQYSIGEAMKVTAQGFKEQRSQVSDAVGWVTNLDQAWKKHASTLGKTIGHLSAAEKNVGGLTVMIQEGAVVQGNASRALELYGGNVSKLSTTIKMMKREIGEGFIPIMDKLAKNFQSIAKDLLDYFKVNRDIIALNVKKSFDDATNSLISLSKILIKILGFLWEHKGLIAFIASLSILNKTIVMLVPIVTGLIRTFTVWVGILKVATTAQEAFMIASMGMEAFLGKYWAIIAALGAIASAYLLLSKSSKEYYNKLREQRALDTQRLRVYEESVNYVKQLREAELSLTKEKIKAGGSSQELTSKEKQLTDQLVILEGQAKATGEAIKKSLLLQNMPDLEAALGWASKKETLSMFGPSGLAKMFSGLTGIGAINVDTKLKGLIEKLNPFDMLVEEWSKTSEKDVAKLKELQLKVLQDLSNITSYGSSRKGMGEEEKQHVDKLKTMYTALLKEIRDKLPSALGGNGGGGEDAEKMKRFWEAVRKLQQDTEEAWLPKSSYQRITEDAKNKIEDLVKLANEAGIKINGNIKKIFDEYVNAKQYEYGLEQIKKMYKAQEELQDKHLKEMAEIRDKAFEDKAKISKENEEKISDLINKYTESRLTDYEREIVAIEKLRNEYEMLLILFPSLGGGIEVISKIFDKMEQQAGSKEMWSKASEWQQNFSTLSDLATDVFVNIRQEEKDTIDALNRELKKGTIDQQEYLARVDLAHRNAAIRVQNAWNNAGKNIAMSMFNYLNQVVMGALSAGKSVSTALSSAFNPASLALGLGLAVVGAAVSAGSASAFKEQALMNYEDISPGTSEAQRKRYGSISAAAPIYLSITPTISITNNEQVLIGSGSITEFEQEVSALMINTVQNAVNNNSIDLSGVSPR